MKLKVEYIKTEALKPYAGNAKTHPAEQIEQIKKSIEEFGFNDPIAIWKDNEVIEGHGRLIAALEMGLETVPVIRLDGLTDEQRRAYTIVHNKLTMNTKFDEDLLSIDMRELSGLFDFSDLGFGDFELTVLTGDMKPEDYDKELMKEYGDHGEEYLAKKRVIITYSAEDEEKLSGILGIGKISKVVYDLSELIS